MNELSEFQILRYQRNLLLKGFGIKGQQRLNHAKVLVVGAGGLGSSAAFYLAAAGIGNLSILDSDKVEMSNLQRQILHTTKDIGKPKTRSAATKLKRLNPDIKIKQLAFHLTQDNVTDVISSHDFILDCTDNFDAKFLINDACVVLSKPFSHCGVTAYKGQCMTYSKGHACFRCVFGHPPEPGQVQTTAEVGILGSVAGLFGCLQATETIKFLTGTGELLLNKLWIMNLHDMSNRTVPLYRNTECKACGI